MSVVHAVLLVLLAAGGTAVVFIDDPVKQAIVLSAFGLLLTLYFVSAGAFDVALSEIVIGAVGLPVLIMLAAARLRRRG